ncbi:Uncharacterized protein TCM_043057 [Theobroma cacao]|uniref:Uncharacterized protein n=1 Tax=Theobroma cacao TaxID=3641 RepID=A0A061FMF2_THECC|nr:Uncharacterized protein TCM_043057 [Theobroma cacao]
MMKETKRGPIFCQSLNQRNEIVGVFEIIVRECITLYTIQAEGSLLSQCIDQIIRPGLNIENQVSSRVIAISNPKEESHHVNGLAIITSEVQNKPGKDVSINGMKHID